MLARSRILRLSFVLGALTLSLMTACRADLREGETGHGGAATGGVPVAGTKGSGGTFGSGGAVAGSGGAVTDAGTPGTGGGGQGSGGASTGGVSPTGGASPGGATSTGGSPPNGGSSSTGGRTGGVGTGGVGTGGVGTGGTTARPLGDACSSGTACASGICADGVCCNAACNGQCEACNSTNAKGTCVAVTTPRTACSGSGACAGRCDGSNRTSCVFPGSTVSCGAAASCASGKATTAALCNGAGTCTASTTTTCSFGCRSDAPLCATSCPSGQAACGGSCVDVLSSPTHCGTSCTSCGSLAPKCLSGACVQCVNGNDCSAGQVCTANRLCQCRPPSSTNILRNPGFDLSLDGGFGNWTRSTTYATTSSTDDADACSGSGSARVAFVTMNMGMQKDFGKLSQCVPAAQNTTYYFGYKFKQETADDTNLCELSFYTGTSCAGSPINFDAVQLSSGRSGIVSSWTGVSTMITTPAGTGSLRILCRMEASGAGSFDQIYLNSAANSY